MLVCCVCVYIYINMYIYIYIHMYMYTYILCISINLILLSYYKIRQWASVASNVRAGPGCLRSLQLQPPPLCCYRAHQRLWHLLFMPPPHRTVVGSDQLERPAQGTLFWQQRPGQPRWRTAQRRTEISSMQVVKQVPIWPGLALHAIDGQRHAPQPAQTMQTSAPPNKEAAGTPICFALPGVGLRAMCLCNANKHPAALATYVSLSLLLCNIVFNISMLSNFRNLSLIKSILQLFHIRLYDQYSQAANFQISPLILKYSDQKINFFL